MSWDQSYSVPSLQALLEKLGGISGTQLLIDYLEAKGVKITDIEDIVLDDGLYQEVKGSKIQLSDGRVFVPKLVERFTADGNYGNDVYEWHLIGDEPEVRYTGDSSDPNLASDAEVASAEGDLNFEDENEEQPMYSGCEDDHGECGCGW